MCRCKWQERIPPKRQKVQKVRLSRKKQRKRKALPAVQPTVQPDVQPVVREEEMPPKHSLEKAISFLR